MPVPKRAAWWLAGLLTCLIAPWWTSGQEPSKEPVPALNKDEEFWFTRAKRRPAAAAQMVLARHPLTIAALRVESLHQMVWEGLEFASEFAPPLNADWLELVEDNRPLPDLRGKAPEELPKSALPTYRAYCQALIYAFQYPPEAFKKSARDNAFIKFPHLWTEPKIHRGKVVPIDGRIVRIRKYEAPWQAKQAGVTHLYEGWVFGDTKRSHPYCVIFPMLPEGFEVTEDMRRQVSFNGYYMGRFTFRVPDKDIDIPLLIGPTIYGAKAPPPVIDATPFSLVVLIGVVALLVGLVAVICGITWWFRKGDRAIQERLSARLDQQALEMMENVEAGTLPEEPAPEATPAPPPPIAQPVDPNRLGQP
ncbi:MAG: hypothetical protein L0Y71_23085 [Gemmataceae bacterium]|nr:hypothetical protein [Gemmataceae bacterium]